MKITVQYTTTIEVEAENVTEAIEKADAEMKESGFEKEHLNQLVTSIV